MSVTQRPTWWLALASLAHANACGEPTEDAPPWQLEDPDPEDDAQTGDTTSPAADPPDAEPDPDGTTGGDAPEVPPPPADGEGVFDPRHKTLHNPCDGIAWQHIGGWILHPYAAPEIGPADEIERCVERYAGWVTNEADAAGVSRASVYAALASNGQCDADTTYDGALLPGPTCTLVHPDLDEATCLDQMAQSKAFGIATLAAAIGHPSVAEVHWSDPPRIAAWLAEGAFACGGDDRWRVAAPPGFLDRYIAAYNAYHARDVPPPACAKRIVMTVALYTGMDTPGVDGVSDGNGCWTYERVSKQNKEWKICNYDGTVHHGEAQNWAFDDTNTNHVASQDVAGIESCRSGTSGRGYVYMTNRGAGWPKRVTEGVDVHFAQVYSGQYTVDDQFQLWKSSGRPGAPMVNFGEPSTGAGKIDTVARRTCDEVPDGGNIGVYIYPESLRTHRMSALVDALDACTGR